MKLRLYNAVNDEPDFVVLGNRVSICEDHGTIIAIDGVEVGYVNEFYGAIHFRADCGTPDMYVTYLSMEITDG